MKKILVAILTISRLAAISQTAPTSSNLKGISNPGSFGSGFIFGTEYKNTNTSGTAGIYTTVGTPTGPGKTTVWGTQANGQAYVWNSKGFLIPRLTTAARNGISSPNTGTLIYNTSTNAFNYYSSGWKIFYSGTTGTRTRIPYFGYDGNLTTDALFYRDSTNNETAIFGQRGDTAVSFYIAPNYGLIAASLETPTDTGSFFVTAENSGISHKSTNGRSSLALFELNGELQQYNTQRDSLNIVGIDSSGFYYENRGADGGTTAKYRFPQDTASVGQVLAVDENDGSGTMQLSWQLPTLTGYTKAQLYLLPNLVAGMRAYCNNAQAPIYGATIIDGGTLKVPVFYDGADWLTY